jgi:hypothetical protein
MGAGAAAGKLFGHGINSNVHVLFYSLFIKGSGVSLLNGDSSGRTLRETGSQAVAIAFRYQLGLPVYQLQGALVAGVDTESAAVAFLLVDRDNFSFHL